MIIMINEMRKIMEKTIKPFTRAPNMRIVSSCANCQSFNHITPPGCLLYDDKQHMTVKEALFHVCDDHEPASDQYPSWVRVK
jgi:hypothetical protein